MKIAMKNSLFILFTSLSFLFSTVLSESLFVFKLIRHGARSPLVLRQQKDILNQEWWKDGQLTEKGAKQLLLHGHLFHTEFVKNKSLISPNYDQNEIHFFSTNYNRTKTSGKYFFKGLFPNHNKEQVLEVIEDTPFDFMSSEDDLKASQKRSSESIQFSKSFSSKHLSKSGLDKVISGNDSLLYEFCDSFISDDFEGKDLSFLNTDFVSLRQDIKDCNSLNWKIYDIVVNQKSKVPSFLPRLKNYIRLRLNKQAGPKAVILFAHDSTISSLLHYLRLTNLTKKDFSLSNIEYASSVSMEVIEEKDKSLVLVIKFNQKEIYRGSIGSLIGLHK